MKTVKMIFSADMFYNDLNIPLYQKGIIYDVPENMVQRWLKRGGEIVVAKPEPTKVVAKEPVEPPVKKSEDVVDEKAPIKSRSFKGNR